MKILFMSSGQEMGGIQCLSAFLKERGHNTALVQDPRLFDNPWVSFPKIQSFFCQKDRLFKEIITERPDIIGFSVVADEFQWALEWAAYIKEKTSIPIVFGNIGPTADPNFTLESPFVDFAVRGEGEWTIFELLEELEKETPSFKEVLGLAYKEQEKIIVNPMRPLINDMDILPFPDKDLFYDQAPYFNYGYTTMTGRGCPYQCTFCDNNTSMKLYKGEGIKSKWTRRHSPERVIEELAWAKEKYNIQHIKFNDEDFSYSKKWTIEFCEKYIESGLNINWFAWVYPRTIDDQIATLMAKAGCDSVEMGVQSGSERIRLEIMNRRTTDDEIIRSVKALKGAGIQTTIDLIVGAPTETQEDLNSTVRLVRDIRPDRIYIFFLRYYDSTEIFNMANKKNWLSTKQMELLHKKSHSRGHLSGGTTLEKDKLTRSYYTFLQLSLFMPNGLIDFFLDKNLIRFTPALPPFLITKLIERKNLNVFEEFSVRTQNMYKTEIIPTIKHTLQKYLKSFAALNLLKD